MIKKIFINITVSIISVVVVVTMVKAFTGPNNPPPIGNPAFWTKSGSDVYYNVSGGNVGIGTATPNPSYKLDVNGKINTPASGGLCIAGLCKTDWNQVQGTSYWTQSGSNLYASSTSWNVGIGTTNPLSALEVNGTVKATAFKAINDGSKTAPSYYFNNETQLGLFRATSGVIGFASGGNETMRIDSSGNVGIGTASPGVKLEVAGQVKITGGSPGLNKVLTSDAAGLAIWQTSASGLPSGTSGQTLRHDGTNWVANSVFYNDGTNIGIGTASPDAKLDIVGGNLDLNNNNIVGVNKITANSIDPVFKINGKNYATYVSDFAGGLRVDTSGVLKLDSIYEIDFNNLAEGSDLWLFWQTSNKNINDLSVILTPGFDGKVWYEKGENKIIIHTEKSGEISYRLSVPRIDRKDGSNLAEDQSIKGIDILDYQK